MEIVEEQDERARTRHLLDEGHEIQFHALLGGGLDLFEHCCRLTAVSGERGDLGIPDRRHLLHGSRDRHAIAALQQAVQRLENGKIGIGAGEPFGAAPAGEGAAAFAAASARKLLYQCGLADTRLAGHQHERTPALACRLEGGSQIVEFRLPPHSVALAAGCRFRKRAGPGWRPIQPRLAKPSP